MSVPWYIAAKLPVLVQARLLGVPTDDFEQIRVWTEALETISGGMIDLSTEEITQAASTFATMKDFFREQFEVKRRQPTALPDSPAERRKALWSARRERLWMASVSTHACGSTWGPG